MATGVKGFCLFVLLLVVGFSKFSGVFMSCSGPSGT